MADISELYLTPAEYRVRLFLSVDLSGSTAFKISASGEKRDKDPAPRWVTVFQNFYKDFPARFNAEFQKQKTVGAGADDCPKLWKAVGDELVFCGTLSNQDACFVAVCAFIDTLHAYRKILQNEDGDLNVKGAGWLAAFPEPNRAVQLPPTDGTPELLPASEALELFADRNPPDYDFLGKAIDTGFRVAGTARPERFVLSVQLARLIVECEHRRGFASRVLLDEPSTLKGINKNEPYPMLYIDTIKGLKNEDVIKLEREILSMHSRQDSEKIASYLDAYCSIVGTDEIRLKENATADKPEPPDSYNDHKERIDRHFQDMVGEEYDGSSNDETENEDVTTQSEDINIASLKPIPDQS